MLWLVAPASLARRFRWRASDAWLWHSVLLIFSLLQSPYVFWLQLVPLA
jgi:hypothetical protein